MSVVVSEPHSILCQVERARKIQRFMSQPFQIAQVFTDSTEGLVHGRKVIDTSVPISIAVGKGTLGRS